MCRSLGHADCDLRNDEAADGKKYIHATGPIVSPVEEAALSRCGIEFGGVDGVNPDDQQRRDCAQRLDGKQTRAEIMRTRDRINFTDASRVLRPAWSRSR